MSTAYPYTTNYDTAFGHLELIDIAKVRDGVTVDWFNQTLCQVNDSVIRLGVVKGEYHWHKHDREDEFFFVVEGMLLIDLEGETIELRPNQGFTIPRGVLHRTRALERTTILMVEPKTVVATGD